MKKIIQLSLLFFSIISASAQNEEMNQKFWDESQIENVQVPEKWKNESAVILYQAYLYDYHKFGKNVKYIRSIHKRVKLLDQAAIKFFSEFNFVKNFKVKRGYLGKEGTKTVGIKIIKTTGEEKIISVDQEAVKKDKDNEFKLAVPGLEVGDILDYYIYVEEPFKQKYGYLFEEVTEVLNDYYPCKKYVLKLNSENDFFINFNSYNGAPKLTEIKTDKRNDRRYVLEANDLEKNEFPFWYYPQVELPFYKFQVTFARKSSNEKSVYNFLPEDENIIQTEVSKEEILKLFSNNDRYRKLDKNKFLRKYFKDKNLSKKEMVAEAYYALRHYKNTQYIQPSIIYELDLKNIINPFEYFYPVDFIKNENQFNYQFAGFLIDNDIPFELIVALPKQNGNIKNILSTDEISLLLKVNLETPIYISKFDTFSTLTLNSLDVENTIAYSMPYDLKEKELVGIHEITIPQSDPSSNYSYEKLEIQMNDDFSSINVESTSSYQGHLKPKQQKGILYFFDYIEEDYKRFDNKNYFERVISNKKQSRLQEKYDAFVDKMKQKRDDYILGYLNSSYDFEIKDNITEILNTGRKNDSSELQYKSKFKIENDLLKKAGPTNYIFEIGKLNGKQITLDKKDRNRKLNIYLDYPSTLSSKMTVHIPKGYKVLGIENLNIQVANEFAEFESHAVIENNQLLVTTKKVYKQINIKNENWNKLLEVLDAAVDFNNQKVLFEKK